MNPIRTICSAALGMMCLFLASCQLNNRVKETPVIGQIATGANIAVQQSEKNETSSLFAPKNYRNLQYKTLATSMDYTTGKPIPTKVTTFEEALGSYSAGTDSEKQQFIRYCAGRIDSNYLEWLEDYITGRASLTTGLDIFSQMLSTAGAIFTPASTVRALSGSSAFVQGVNSSIENNFFLSLTVLKQVPAMDRARKAARTSLEACIKGDGFDMHEAAGHLDSLFMAGTQFTAMASATE